MTFQRSKKHETDPGYTGGVGLYLSDDDGWDYNSNAELFEADADGLDPTGKYDSYRQAIDGEMNPYGFTMYKNKRDGKGGSGKYHIAETAAVKKIYGFSLYADLPDEEFDDRI